MGLCNSVEEIANAISHNNSNKKLSVQEQLHRYWDNHPRLKNIYPCLNSS